MNKESDIEEESENESIGSELLHKAIYENKDFTSLINEIVEDIESRFSLVNKGFLRLKDKWPQYWEFETANRKEFLDSLQIFSSNKYKDFGKLLTPLVQGMRVQGPFYSENLGEEYPRLVFFDGQGLGHTAESAKALSLPQSIENKFEMADVILLVDNASQPMQHSSLLVLRSVVASGYTDRLKIAFTHFDLIEGENFGSRDDRKMHVYSSLTNGLSNLKKDTGPMVECLEIDLDERCFFLEDIRKSELEIEVNTLKQLEKLLHDLQKKIKPNYMVDLKPQYEGERLCDEIYSSVKRFRMMWDIRFSGVARIYDTCFDSHDVKKEHWARIKALNRRIAEFGITEYSNLMPVSELRDFIKVQISSYLEDSLIWGAREPSNEDKYEFREAVKRNVSKELGEYIKTQMIDEHMEYWIQANNYSGIGSSKLRAKDIDTIYDQVSPRMKRSANWREHAPKMKKLVDDSINLTYEATMDKFTETLDEPSNFIDWDVN